MGDHQTRQLSVVPDESSDELTLSVKLPCSPQAVGAAEAVDATDEATRVEVVFIGRLEFTPKAPELLLGTGILCADEFAMLFDKANAVSETKLDNAVEADTSKVELGNKISDESLEAPTPSDDRLVTYTALEEKVVEDVKIVEFIVNVIGDDASMLPRFEMEGWLVCNVC